MPLSPNTDMVPFEVKPGVEYVITADDGTLAIQSVVREGTSTYRYDETAVGDGADNRTTYLGPAHVLEITPSAANVFWTVTKVVKS